MVDSAWGDVRVVLPRKHSGRLPRFYLAGALAIVSVLLCLPGCSDPGLEVWHTEKLSAEFTASKSEQIVSFDDYRRLEDELFEQLEEEVYSRTETGPGHALERYSAGSAADPQRWRPNWNRSFEFTVDTPVGGVLLLHGMSDSPYSLRALGEKLNEQDYQVVGLRLPGHGTAPSGLTTVSWQDMGAAVKLAMEHLGARLGQKPIHIIGYSTGAPLALDYVLDAEQSAVVMPASLVLVSPAIGISPAAALATWKRRLSLLPGLEGLAWLQIQPEFDPYKYNSFPTNAAEQVHLLTRSVARRMAARSQSSAESEFPPILVLKSAIDATVSTDAVIDNLFAHLAANRHELVLFDINRFAMKASLLISSPAVLTTRVTDDETLPFQLTLVSNENAETTTVVARHKAPFSSEFSSIEPLPLAWPRGVISLSHVALPFPTDDPLYGQRPPDNEDVLFLGEMAIQGERGLLKLPADWLLRLRYNPFYSYLEWRVLDWVSDQ